MFKVGDRVICIDNKHCDDWFLKFANVTDIGLEYDRIRVKYDEKIQGRRVWSGGKNIYEKVVYSNALNKKLYPDREEYKGFLVPANLADKLGEEREY